MVSPSCFVTDEVSVTEAPYAGFFLAAESVGPTAFVAAHQHPRYGPGWLLFREASETLTAWHLADVTGVVEAAAAACDRGNYAAGFVAYDAAPAFDPALEAHKADNQPLVSFHIYGQVPEFYKELEPVSREDASSPRWVAELDEAGFSERFTEIKALLRSGATYQVNLSFRLHASGITDLAKLFSTLVADEPPPYASLFRSPSISLLSLSPELFLEWTDGQVRCKPMKGTACRGATGEEDAANVASLQDSEKDRAENLMVVDMVRNDLGRIAEIGSVVTSALFDVETYTTVHQMTSTVEGRFQGRMVDLLFALFPCASVVGAPKVATMRYIKRLEASPRGMYTGAIGWMGPGSSARFAVAIRTITACPHKDVLIYGIGSGIVWDSDCDMEWRECLVKSDALYRIAQPWGLVETIGWTEDGGYRLLHEHMRRLASAATSLGIALNTPGVLEELRHRERAFRSDMRVRVVLHVGGDASIGCEPLCQSPPNLQARLATEHVCSEDPSLRLKTTRRSFFQRQLEHCGVDEALLWNEKQEITEFCTGNVVADLGGRFLTPPVECGLLPGIMRAELIRSGCVIEGRVTIAELHEVRQVFRINSVRGIEHVELIR